MMLKLSCLVTNLILMTCYFTFGLSLDPLFWIPIILSIDKIENETILLFIFCHYAAICFQMTWWSLTLTTLFGLALIFQLKPFQGTDRFPFQEELKDFWSSFISEIKAVQVLPSSYGFNSGLSERELVEELNLKLEETQQFCGKTEDFFLTNWLPFHFIGSFYEIINNGTSNHILLHLLKENQVIFLAPGQKFYHNLATRPLSESIRQFEIEGVERKIYRKGKILNRNWLFKNFSFGHPLLYVCQRVIGWENIWLLLFVFFFLPHSLCWSVLILYFPFWDLLTNLNRNSVQTFLDQSYRDSFWKRDFLLSQVVSLSTMFWLLVNQGHYFVALLLPLTQYSFWFHSLEMIFHKVKIYLGKLLGVKNEVEEIFYSLHLFYQLLGLIYLDRFYGPFLVTNIYLLFQIRKKQES